VLERVKVAIVGVGAMGRGILSVLRRAKDIEVVAVADVDRGALERAAAFVPKDSFVTTKPLEIFAKKPDVLVEATSTIIEAVFLVRGAIEHKTNVILMNSEVDQTFGLLLAREAEAKGVILTSDAGDQHGVLVRTMNDVRQMGFEIVMAGNNKGFLDHYATPESVIEEAARRRLSLKQCTAYTDGTKLAIEMALVANATALDILQTGMVGPKAGQVGMALQLFDLPRARSLGGVVDYVLGAEPGGSVFVIGYSGDPEDNSYMNYYKMGNGPYYLFSRPYHVCHFETPYAIQRVMKYNEPVLVQKGRFLEVGCRAKIDLPAGTRLEGVGGHHLYGILEHPDGLPIGMAESTVLLREKKKDEAIGWDEVEFPESDPRLDLWRDQMRLVEHAK
jgi:predicted homoserine dehydrogenase-like protein